MADLPPFAHRAAELTNREIVIWLTTTSRDLSPQPRPVWFIWHQEHFLIYSRPETHKIRHIQERPNVALHFNSDSHASRDVVVFKGVARIAPEIPPAHEVPAYAEKYAAGFTALGMTPAQFGAAYSTPIMVAVKEVEGMA